MISPRTKVLSPIAADVFTGLSSTPKALPPKLFYDEFGSNLFDAITELPEYYLTRTEQQILDDHSDEIVQLAAATSESKNAPALTVIELGAGSATKTRTILRAALKNQSRLHFFPLDVSSAALDYAAGHLSEIPGLTVTPVVADYTSGLPRLPGTQRGANTRKLVLYIGSSIGNFEPMEATAMLARIRRSLSPGDALLLGTDLAKDQSVLIPAYDDAAGVTAAFNKNILARINRELGGHFDLDSFRHLALWNRHKSRIEMHLESTLDQTIAIDDLELTVAFSRGERIHTENSYKFTSSIVESILQNSGFAMERTWTDDKGWYALHLARVKESSHPVIAPSGDRAITTKGDGTITERSG